MKYVARLMLIDFNHSTSYEELFLQMKWHPLYWKIVEKRLISMQTYRLGLQFILDCVFPVEKLTTSISSERLRNLLDQGTVDETNIQAFTTIVRKELTFQRLCEIVAVTPLSDMYI
jgi:hypothetical protein